MNDLNEIDSSYKINKYNVFFDWIIKSYKPKICYEFGILNGYSTISIANSLKEINFGHLYSCDLFEEYPYKNSKYLEFKEKIKNYDLEKFCTIEKIDVFDKINSIEDNSVDFVHFDISNDGEKVIKFLKLIFLKLKKNGIILFEGGSKERDEIEWMKKFNKLKISNVFDDKFFKENYNFYVFTPFPSITICSKKD